MLNFVPSAGQADPSNPMESGLCPRREVALPPTVRARARRPASRDPIGRSKNWIQKQSSPCIRKVQHAVLSVAGLKGTMAQAELHFLHARLQGGKLNKAKKGELRFPLPVGYCYDEDGRISPDADAEVRGAVELVFRLFRETGSAYAVVQRFSEGGLRFPKRAYGGAWDGKLIWGRLSHGRVLGLLKNPSYAGMYVFGRYQYRRGGRPGGKVSH